MSMQGKIIAITGGASGIGLSTAKILSSRGATVCLADIDSTSLQAASSEFTNLRVPFTTTQVNVSKAVEVDTWIKGIVEKFGKLDGAANCAGVIGKRHGIGKITELEDEDWDRIMGVNLTGLMYCLRAELRVIAEKGSIVNVSSIQGVMGFSGSAAYAASKHGVVGITRSAAKEVGDREIRVNAVAPGAIWTPLLQRAREENPDEGEGNPTAIKRIGTPEEIAGIICFLLGDECGYTTGSVFGGDGGWNC